MQEMNPALDDHPEMENEDSKIKFKIQSAIAKEQCQKIELEKRQSR